MNKRRLKGHKKTCTRTYTQHETEASIYE